MPRMAKGEEGGGQSNRGGRHRILLRYFFPPTAYKVLRHRLIVP